MNTALFETAYLQARRLEGRLYNDETACRLPHLTKKEPLYKEWKIRASSAKMLCRYLNKKTKTKNILEIGCGNGWLTAYLAGQLPLKQFTGIDINQTELAQAQRIHKLPNASFAICNIFEQMPTNAPFQCIILASVTQYFTLLPQLIKRLLEFGAEELEIYIMDSPFYEAKTIEKARSACKAYYEKLGVPAMQQYYNHHTYKALEPFCPKIYYRPLYHKIANKIGVSYRSPFPVIGIEKRLCTPHNS